MQYKKNAFTLTELLVVVGILAILFAIVLIAINPQQQFYKVNETKVKTDLKVLREALYNCYTEHMQDNSIQGSCYNGIPSGSLDNVAQGSYGNVSQLDLCPLVLNGYIAKLPVNTLYGNTAPQTGSIDTTLCNNAGYAYNTGFQVVGLTTGSVSDIQIQSSLPGISGVDEMVVANQEGIHNNTSGAAPTPIQWRQVAPGGDHTCALRVDGKIACWGNNTYGQLTGSASSSKPLLINSNDTYMAVGTGANHTCAVRSDKKILCWGWGYDKQLGDGTTSNASTPKLIQSNDLFTQVVAGSQYSCGLRTDGAAVCWGSAYYPSLPTEVPGGYRFTKLAASVYTTCGVRTDGKIMCWGWHYTANSTSSPYLIQGTDQFKEVAASTGGGCGLTTTNDIKCFGEVGSGRSGDGVTTTYVSIPVTVAGGYKFTHLSTGGGNYYCALRTDGKALCWGYNADGQIGDGTTNNALIPTLVQDGNVFTSLDVGEYYHACGITVDGQIMCWGKNSSGMLGNNSTASSSRPVNVYDPNPQIIITRTPTPTPAVAAMVIPTSTPTPTPTPLVNGAGPIYTPTPTPINLSTGTYQERITNFALYCSQRGGYLDDTETCLIDSVNGSIYFKDATTAFSGTWYHQDYCTLMGGNFDPYATTCTFLNGRSNVVWNYSSTPTDCQNAGDAYDFTNNQCFHYISE